MKKQNRTVLCLLFFALSVSLMAQSKVTGKVTDEAGDALIGVNILLEGTSSGTISDLDGAYSITVPSPASVIIFTYTGFEQVAVVVGSQSVIDVKMGEDSQLLDEVVVVGYGSSSKRNLTDNVAKIDSRALENVPISNFQSGLSGRAAGVRVTPNNGKVDAGMNIRVRGTSSISAGTDPLYVIDGIPLINIDESSGTAGPLNPLLSLSPTEIESIEILKDASSAAIYGARGANGVVLITTKTGKKGKPSVSLNMSTGVSSPTNTVEWLNTEQYLEFFREAAANTGESDYIEDLFVSLSGDNAVGAVDTDWNDEVFRQGSQQTVDFSVSGGDGKTSYYFGGAYNDTEGIILGNNLARFSSRVNVSHNFNDRFLAGLN